MSTHNIGFYEDLTKMAILMSTHNIGFYEDLTKMAILMSTHNIGFYEDLTKIISNYHQICTLFFLLEVEITI